MLTRRKFIQQSSMLAAALMVDKSAMFKMHKDLGLQLYTVRDEVAKAKDLQGLGNIFSKIAGAGYRQVELYGYNNRKYFGHSIKEMSDLLKQHNLKTPSGHYGLNDMLLGAEYNGRAGNICWKMQIFWVINMW